jgi:two-component system sensor histidine kinase KdpD
VIRTIDIPIRVEASGNVLADGGRLRQILRNLVSNAQRYGGGEIKVTAGRVANEVLIVVADRGPGIPAGLEDRVFEPFTSARDDNGLPASVGLGLAVSRNLATLMGGNLSYVREDGWSRLDLVLPAPADG